MENEELVKEVKKLRAEMDALLKREKMKDRVIRNLTKQFKNATKQIKTLKTKTSNNSGSIDTLRNALRNMGR